MSLPFELTAFLNRLASDAGLKLSLALVHFLWQGVLVAALAAVMMRLIGRRSPQRRYLIGVMGMLAMALAPLVTFCLVEPPHWPEPIVASVPVVELSSQEIAQFEALLATYDEEAVPIREPIAPIRPLTWPERIRLWQPYALLLWLCGTGLFAMRLGIGVQASWRFGRKRRSLPEEWREVAARVAKRLGVAAPRVFVSDRIVEAVAVGLLRPMVLLPAAWVGQVPLDVLEAVLAHEIAHLRRYDLWVNLLQRGVEAALFYHPAVWWLSRRIRIEREYCCDEMAATVVSGRAAYARALEYVARERVASTRRPVWSAAMAAGMGGSHMALLDRVRRVLGSDVRPSRSTWLSEGLLALAVPAALWAGVATIAPAVATADDPVKTTNDESSSAPDAHIGDVDYWRERGVEAGMITVLKDGRTVDLATGQFARSRPPGFVDLNDNWSAQAHDPQKDASHQDFGPAGKILQELRDEMKQLRREMNEIRQHDEAKRRPGDATFRALKAKRSAEEHSSHPTRVPSNIAAAQAQTHDGNQLEVQTFPVADLVKPAGTPEDEWKQQPSKPPQQIIENLKAVTELITRTIEPGSWENVGGNALLRVNEDTLSLVVLQTRPVHEQIAELLATLRTLERNKHAQDATQVSRVVPLMVNGKRIEVIVEEIREGAGPARQIELRILKDPQPGETLSSDPAAADAAKKTEDAARKAEEEQQPATERVDQATREIYERVERQHRQTLAQQASRDAAEAAEKHRELLQELQRVVASDHPKIREAAARLGAAEQRAERQRILAAMLEAHPEMPVERVEREVDAVLEGKSGTENADSVEALRREAEEAWKRASEWQRQLQEQSKALEQLQKKLAAPSEELEKQDAALKPLIERFDALMREKEYAEALLVAKEAQNVAPDHPETISMFYRAELIRAKLPIPTDGSPPDESRRTDQPRDAADASEPTDAERRLKALQQKLDEQSKTIEHLQKKLGEASLPHASHEALRPLINEYNGLINKREFAAALEVAKRAREQFPHDPATIPLLYKAKTLLDQNAKDQARPRDAFDEKNADEAGSSRTKEEHGVNPPPAAKGTTQVRLVAPAGMTVHHGGKDGHKLDGVAPARLNLQQDTSHELQFTSVPDRPGLTIRASVEVAESVPQSRAFLTHNSVPFEFTTDDLDQLESHSTVTKVIYLPSSRNQDLADGGVETLVSTRLDPGVDPVAEAKRRGTILAVLRFSRETQSTWIPSLIPNAFNAQSKPFSFYVGVLR